MIEIKGFEITALYLILKKEEDKLDEIQSGLLGKVERFLYHHLSVQEIENIDDLYLNRSDIVLFEEK